MNSKDVSRRISTQIKPLLVEAGFSESTSRSFYRYHDDRTDVISFQSLGSHQADRLHSTSYSFALILGCKLNYVPNRVDIPEKDGQIRPDPYACNFFRRLKRGYFLKIPWRRDIWHIQDNEDDLEKVFLDAKQQLQKQGLPWFENFKEPSSIINILKRKPWETDRFGGIGNKKSPIRNYLMAYVFKRMNCYDQATKHFEVVRSCPMYETLFPSMANTNNE